MSKSAVRRKTGVTVNDLVRALEGQGWRSIRKSHVKQFVVLEKPGSGSPPVVLPRNSGEVPRVVLRQICRTVGVKPAELIEV